MSKTRFTARALALALVLVLAVGVASCGSDDDGSGANSSGQSSSTSEQDQVKAAMAAIQDMIFSGDAKGVCDAFTKKVAREMAASVRGASTCEKVVGFYALPVSPEQAQKQKAPILSVKVDGDRAVVASKGFKDAPTTIKFLKEDGEWKMAQGFGGASQ